MKILYPWHPDFGRDVYIARIQLKGGKLFYNYRFDLTKKQIAKEIPAWMFDEKFCSDLKISSSPSFTEESLFSLKEILDEVISGMQGSENTAQIPGYMKHEEKTVDPTRTMGISNTSSAME